MTKKQDLAIRFQYIYSSATAPQMVPTVLATGKSLHFYGLNEKPSRLCQLATDRDGSQADGYRQGSRWSVRKLLPRLVAKGREQLPSIQLTALITSRGGKDLP